MRQESLAVMLAAVALAGCRQGVVAHAAPDARQDAMALAQAVFAPLPNSTTGRLPAFLTWNTRSDACPPASGAAPAATDVFNLVAAGFFYDPALAFPRLCSTVIPSTVDPAAPRMRDNGIAAWWRKRGMTPTQINPPFPDGARAVGAMFAGIRQGDPARISLNVRNGLGVTLEAVSLTMPPGTPAVQPGCPAPAPRPAVQPAAAAGVQTVNANLNDFYWIRLQPGDKAGVAACGDFEVLVGLNLIEKKGGVWLWSTFWWDPASTAYSTANLGAANPGTFPNAAGANPAAWKNYAMDAQYGTMNPIFNPNSGTESPTTNCQLCHQTAAIPLNVPLNGIPPVSSQPALTFDSIFAGPKLQRSN